MYRLKPNLAWYQKFIAPRTPIYPVNIGSRFTRVVRVDQKPEEFIVTNIKEETSVSIKTKK